MSTRLEEIRSRRAQLVQRAARQRDDIARTLQSLSLPVAVIDRSIALWAYLKSRPALLAVSVILVLALRPRRTFKLIPAALALWQVYRRLSARLAAS
jgi:hypothetical protein